ncbi:unnamed protein product [Acanthoscelides obtectus]|nr:unnamed protein product [Acanthoscelides obtectus]CAK1630071.1 Serine/threonine-protein kinase Warts [Acanthoscelides obtectus]
MGYQPRWARTIQHQSANQHQCASIGLPQGLQISSTSATLIRPEGEDRWRSSIHHSTKQHQCASVGVPQSEEKWRREGRKLGVEEADMQNHHGGGVAPGPGGNASATTPNGPQVALQAAARPPAYMQKAMEEIKNSLRPFAKESCMGGSSAASTISSYSATSGLGSSLSSATSNSNDVAQLRHLFNMGYVDVPGSGDRPSGYTKLMRKASVERELPATARGSPALDSGAASTRSDSPRLTDIHSTISRYSPSFAEPPPPPPPRNTPPPPPPPHCGTAGGGGAVTAVSAPPPVVVPSNVQQMFKRMSPAPPPIVPARGGQQSGSVPGVGVVAQPQSPAAVVYSTQGLQQRGTSPVSSVSSGAGTSVGVRPQPMVVANGPAAQQQLTQQMQALRNGGGSGVNGGGAGGGVTSGVGQEPPPPYPVGVATTTQTGVAGQPTPPPPPSYRDAIQNRQSPTQDFRKSPSSGIYSGSTSAGSPSPVTVSSSCSSSAMARPAPLQAWGARQTVSQPPIIMQSVKSTQVQKPVLQTAVAPAAPQQQAQPQQATVVNGGAVVAVATEGGPGGQQPPPPSYTASMQQKGYTTVVPKPAAPLPTGSPAGAGAGVVNVPTTEPPSYASTMQAKAAKAQQQRAPPPPPYTPTPASVAIGVGDDPTATQHICPIDGHQMQPSPR